MLSRTADHLYWMSRYIERAESLARLVDAHYQMSLLPHSGETLAQSLSSTMTALRMEDGLSQAPRRRRTRCRVPVREPGSRLRRQHLQLPALGARERPRRARLADLGALGDPQFHLARTALAGCAALTAGRHRLLRRVGQGALAPHPRRHRRHHDARRSLPLLPHRHLSRARRRHRAHSHRAPGRPHPRRRRRRRCPIP